MHLMKDYNREFDQKMQDVRSNKRTFSQQFSKAEFQELIQSRNKIQKSALTEHIQGKNQLKDGQMQVDIDNLSGMKFKAKKIEKNEWSNGEVCGGDESPK